MTNCKRKQNDAVIPDGYVLLARRLKDSKLWQCPPDTMRVAMYLLHEARWKAEPKQYPPDLNVHRGQVLTSLRDIAEECSWWENRKVRKYSAQKIKRIIDTLCEIGFCKRISDTFGTHLSICNYETYQDAGNYISDNTVTAPLQQCDNSVTNSNKGNKANKENNNTPRKHIDNATNRMTKSEVDDEFDRFWAEYPNKKAKLKARAKFRAALNASEDTPTPETLITGAEQYAKWCRHTGQEVGFIAHPTTWLNQGRWLDELDFNQNKPKQKPKPVDPDVARSQSLSGIM